MESGELNPTPLFSQIIIAGTLQEKCVDGSKTSEVCNTIKRRDWQTRLLSLTISCLRKVYINVMKNSAN